MSRNVVLAIIVIIVVFLALLLFSRRGTNTQTGIISPTPQQQSGTMESPTPTAMQVSPTTTVVSGTPAVSPTTSLQVTVAPTQ